MFNYTVPLCPGGGSFKKQEIYMQNKYFSSISKWTSKERHRKCILLRGQKCLTFKFYPPPKRHLGQNTALINAPSSVARTSIRMSRPSCSRVYLFLSILGGRSLSVRVILATNTSKSHVLCVISSIWVPPPN